MAKDKTPVSELCEVAQRERKFFPEYIECDSEMEDGATTFLVKAVFGDLQAIGRGKRKQDAKHDSAKKILLMLNDENIKTIDEPTKDVDYISSLCNYCITENLMRPSFSKDYSVDGNAVICKIGPFETKATSITKKQAEHFAAKEMLTNIMNELISVNEIKVKDIPIEKVEKIIVKAQIPDIDNFYYSHEEQIFISDKTFVISKLHSSSPTLLKFSSEKELKQLSNANIEKTLKKILNELKLQYRIYPFSQSWTEDVTLSCTIKGPVDNPLWTVWDFLGIGNTEENAELNLYLEILKFFITMSKSS